MQEEINKTLLDKNIPKKDKINIIKSIFEKYNITCFSDLDDTITNNYDVFYSKVKFINKYKKSSQNTYFNILLKDFKINIKFLDLVQKENIKKIFILSRNSQDFIDFFINNTKNILLNYWLEIVWWIWVNENFNIITEDKLEIIPKNSLLISDIFEYKKLKLYSNFVCIDNFSYYKYYKIIILKIFYLAKFIIKNV